MSMQLVPVIVRYFLPVSRVKNRILEYLNFQEKTVEIIHAHIVKVLNENALKITSYSAE